MARITVITPVFNGERFITACVENVAAQNVDQIEHLVIDGGSADSTVPILKSLSRDFPHLRFISEPDSGQSDAMNKGVRSASSDIIGFLNVDDYYEPGAINEALSFLELNPSVDFVAGDCNMRDESDAIQHVNRPKDLTLENILIGWDCAEYPVNPSAYFYRKRIHDVIGEYRTSEHYLMDIRFLYSCLGAAKTAYVPSLWGNFRQLPGTKTVSNRAEAPAMMRKVRREYVGRLPLRRRLPFRIRELFWDVRRAYWEAAKSRSAVKAAQ